MKTITYKKWCKGNYPEVFYMNENYYYDISEIIDECNCNDAIEDFQLLEIFACKKVY